METNQQNLESIQDEISRVQSAYANMRDFDAWDWGAYKVEAHEKDAVMNALQYYLGYLRETEEKLHDNTELCE